jgi:hypothetical protein
MTSGTAPDTSATERCHARRARNPSPHAFGQQWKMLPAVLQFLWLSSRGYRLRPWASPYLRWRIETYCGWHADQIGARRFCAFTWQQRRALWRFLQWAATMASQQNHRLHS